MRLNIRLDLTSEHVRDRLLDGLDQWVNLGLLSEHQIRVLAETMSEPVRARQSVQESYTQPYGLPPFTGQQTDFLDEEPALTQRRLRPDYKTETPPRERRAAKAFRSLLEEFSVIWLLFLGVFLVVVSSAVLAASQWQSFTSVGQYAILLGYTLLFWVASIQAGAREKLQATARMLSLTTLLLIPINFWMMDALRVMNSAMGLVVGLLAALLLSFVALKQLDTKSYRFNLIGLSWLHLGWWIAGGAILGGASGWPLVATYIGTVGTAANLTYWHRKNGELVRGADDVDSDRDSSLTDKLLSFDALAIALAVTILLFRSLFIAQVPPHQLGLAAGICGWLLVWLTKDTNAGVTDDSIEGIDEEDDSFLPRDRTPHLWGWAGSGLLLAGWGMTIAQPQPWQAIAISFLAISLLWDALTRHWKPAVNFALIVLAAQTYWLFGALIPPSTRDTVLTRLAAQLSPIPIQYSEWLSLAFIPFLAGMLLFASVLTRWKQQKLATDTEWLSLGLGACLTLLSVTNRFTLMANLLLSTALLAIVLRRRQKSSIELVTLTHVVGLGAIAATILYVAPGLSYWSWACFALGGAVGELMLHLTLRHTHWRTSTWQLGLALYVACYWLLLLNQDLYSAFWMWLTVPATLSFVAHHKRALYPKTTAILALIALVAHTPSIFARSFLSVILSFAVGTICAIYNTRIIRTTAAAAFTVGSGLVLVATTILWFYVDVRKVTSGAQLYVYWPLTIWGLWLWRRQLMRKAGELRKAYRTAALGWSLVMMGLMLAGGTALALAALDPSAGFISSAVYSHTYAIASFILLIATLLEAIYHKPAEWRYWSLAWATEILVIFAIAYQGGGLKEIAIATLALGLAAQMGGDIWTLKRPPYRPSWHGIPMVYAVLGAVMGHIFFVADSGLFTVFAGAIFIGVGRRQASLNPFSYIGLGALSVGAYELLIYRMLQASGGSPGDGFTLLVLLGIAIAYAHRILSRWLLRYLLIPAAALQRIAHMHWLVGFGFAFFATLAGFSFPGGILLWTVASSLLVMYALATGNRKLTPELFATTYMAWTSVGILLGLAIALHNRIVWFPDRMFLVTWGGIAACVGSLILARIRWKALGWPPEPWDILALWLPLSVLSVAVSYTVPTQTLLVVGAFYAWMAKARQKINPGYIRLSYISIALLDWTLLRYLNMQGWLSPLSVSLVTSLSIIALIELEPGLRGADRKPQRHLLRVLASGLISLAALYQTETYTPTLVYAALTLALCTVLIFAGLALKTRAFLYVGTTTFVLQVLRVLWLFISVNSLILWAVGIVIGLFFIWVAATFESRRSQVMARWDSWTAAIQGWE